MNRIFIGITTGIIGLIMGAVIGSILSTSWADFPPNKNSDIWTPNHEIMLENGVSIPVGVELMAIPDAKTEITFLYLGISAYESDFSDFSKRSDDRTGLRLHYNIEDLE